MGLPDGTLAGREVAAYVVSEALGWDVVPPTGCGDGPHGAGHGAGAGRSPTPSRTRSPSCAAGECRPGWLARLRRRRRARPRRLPGPRGHRRAAPDGGLRRAGQQRRPQGRPRARDARRAPVRRRPRRDLPRRAQAAHRAVGLGAASRSTDEEVAGVPRCCARARAATWARRSPAHLTDPRSTPSTRRCARLLDRGVLPDPARRVAGHPVAAVLTPTARLGFAPCAPGPPRSPRPARRRARRSPSTTPPPGGRSSTRARRPGAALRLRHHAVRRHPHRPRRDVRRLRPAQPGLAQRRPRGHLRPERHRRRRPAARAGREGRRRLGRARRARDRAVPPGHGGAAGAPARRTTSARSSRSRSSSS